ncbi:MAG: tRNA (cytidine(34)-2'-O)-methyltransferase [Planctomycetota bacterium]
MFPIALYQPVIPQNVGNISRTCVGMGAPLHVIGPTLVDFDDAKVRRAGLDHWDDLDLTLHDSPEEFVDWLTAAGKRPWLVTKFGSTRYDRADYTPSDDVLLFGAEKVGLPEAWRDRWAERCVHIPIPSSRIRSYNLANSVAVLLSMAMSRSNAWPSDWSPAPERGDEG